MSRLDSSLRRALLLKVLAKPQPSPEDLESVIELASNKVIEALEVQSMTLYLVQDSSICFRWVYYSKTFGMDDEAKRKEFERRRQTLLGMRLPIGSGIVGKTILTGVPQIFDAEHAGTGMLTLSKDSGFEVRSMLTVPLKVGAKVIGAIQVLNREPYALLQNFRDSDLALLSEVAEFSAPLIQRMLDADYRCSDADTAGFIASFTGSPLVLDESVLDIDSKVVEIVDPALVRRTQILPFRRISANAVAVLMANPMDYTNRDSFELASDLRIEEISVAPASLIDKLLKKYTSLVEQGTPASGDASMDELTNIIGEEYGLDKASGKDGKEDILADEDSAPIIQLANRIIEDAYLCGASDIHIEPQEYDLLVRYRVDGVLQEKLRLPAKVAGALVARIKVMSDLDIAEKRMPQDGRIVFKKFTRKKMDIDLRIATGPMNFGEKVCMRILDKSKSALPITALGFSEENLVKYRECIFQPYGMILHCGPTGSGKSMTLFSALREVASPDVNIHTAEDPIEYTIPGINQMQMHKQIGLTFATALRCYLRMDPDIILVGEIRDEETAQIAVEAALTGHLLLSTLHTNDAPSTIAV
ncbi:MAG: Flp pilus assembly complex ATPase component TadA [Verrucomicrobia bacterium]|nr:Flp pilus assembly complex ATPase component TadA [Verrucomicrobiota bacterium]